MYLFRKVRISNTKIEPQEQWKPVPTKSLAQLKRYMAGNGSTISHSRWFSKVHRTIIATVYNPGEGKRPFYIELRKVDE